MLVDLLQPGHRFDVFAPEPLELMHDPPGEVLVDVPCEEAQLGAVEGAVVVTTTEAACGFTAHPKASHGPAGDPLVRRSARGLRPPR